MEDEPMGYIESNTQTECGKQESEKSIKKLNTTFQGIPDDENVNAKQGNKDKTINKSETEDNRTAATEITAKEYVMQTIV
ncbi:hypothetical protein DPMN_099106 [Dreissena polymorpha]|uniref:Uncharacterized protein n=1 Tax=Dreissena polymorpha TaxID=45954 RepID=A0A9D4R643_DREPO|nr:hypothetical protein DPMN_099106 [Dreissena polymorpha]